LAHPVEKNPKNWGALGPRPLAVGAWLTPGNTPLPTCVILPSCIILHQTVPRSLWKVDSLRPTFQGHSGSSERSVATMHLSRTISER